MRHSIQHNFLAFLFGVFFFLSMRTLIYAAEQQEIELEFKQKTLSAHINNARLRSVIEAIREKRGIWFKSWIKGKGTILEEKISIRLDKVPVKEALGRILSNINHCLVFDEEGYIIGVFLLGEPEKTRYRGRTPSRRSYRRR